ncbi:MAG TPA: aldehyde dehydrogenase family protein, partial [Sphingomonadales bacterium]|nr:aldehyde dehydrogenase family protein [Sphingomonadales bacterium]
MSAFNVDDTLRALGLEPKRFAAGSLSVFSPIDGALIGRVNEDSEADVERKIGIAVKAFENWRDVPAPKRGEVVRRYADILRKNKEALGTLVTIENGKILEEGKGEVQEMIDI